MIYLDNAATTLQKPPAVPRAASYAMCHMATPGRGGHAPPCWRRTRPSPAGRPLRSFFR